MFKNKYFIYSTLALGVMLQSCKNDSTETENKYPTAHRGTVADQYFGTMIEDPYRWLEYEESEDVKKWVVAENEVTQNYLKTISFRDKLSSRLKEIWNYPRQGAPYREGENYFFSKNDGLQNQSVMYMQKGLTGTPKVFLDPNTLSTDGTTSLSNSSFSKDGKLMAYGISKAGSDWNEFYVMNVETGKKMSDELKWIKFSGADWQGNGFYYTKYPQPKNDKDAGQNINPKIYFHEVGKPQAEDKMIFDYPQDPMMGLGTTVSEDEKHLLVYLTKGATDNSAIHYKNLGKPESAITPLIPGFDNYFGFIDNDGETLIFITDKGAAKRRIVKIDPKKPDEKNWRVIVPEGEGTIQGASLLGDELFVTYMIDAKHQVKVYSLKTGAFVYDVALPGLGSVGGFGGHREDTVTFFSFTSFVQPTTIYKYNLNSRTAEVYWKAQVKFPFENYETKQVFFTSKDGTKIPMFLTHKKGMALDGNNPTYLYGYGGFNISVLPGFNASILPFLEAGGIYASVNLRGGGEYGDAWHKAGMLEKKQNVFDDFIGAAEYLIKEQYTSSGRLAISGRSNGGLLVGACMTQRPDLYKVALPGVGVLDMLRFHKFTIGHAWVPEYGSSEANKAQFDNLYRYSPYHNLKKGTKYPATLVTTADHDDRVVPYHSFKFAAQLQHSQAGDAPVMIRIETSAGHGAGKSTTKVIEEWADIWAFTFHNLGMKY